MNRTFSIFIMSCFLALSGCFSSVAQENETLADPPLTLLYYSDYFSFIGRDDQGYVAFAIDNNRGRDGDAYQAEHFVVLHDEQRGWIELSGNGSYENPKKALKTIPDSPHFQFSGTPEKGMLISSPANRLKLELAPVTKRLTRGHKGGVYWMGSVEGTLYWEKRSLRGRLIYEYLYRPGFNRLTRNYPSLWKDFHGIYALVEGGGDLYWHTRQDSGFKDLTGQKEGFFFHRGKTERLEDLEVKVMERVQAIGTYSWPVQWSGQWRKGEASFTLKLSELNAISNWVIGGFSMGIVKGELRYGRSRWTFYGLGELLI